MSHRINRINSFIRRLHLDWLLRKIIPFIEQVDRTNFQGETPRKDRDMTLIISLPRDIFESLKEYDEKLTASYDDKSILFWLCGKNLDIPYEEWELTISWGKSNHRTYEIDLDFGTLCGEDMQRVIQINKDGMNELITAFKTAEWEKKPTKFWD